MKRFLSLVLALTIFSVAFAACNKTPAEGENYNEAENTSQADSEEVIKVWPENERTAKVPEFKGKISSISETDIDTGKGTTIHFNDVEKKDFNKYRKTVEKEGFEFTEGEAGQFYTAKKDKFSVTLIYYPDTSKLTVMLVEAK